MLLSDTDMPLSSLGIQSQQTPDYISIESQLIIELTTSKSDNQPAMERAYKKKVLTYEPSLRGTTIKMGVLVVSPTSVYTNCFLRPDMIAELCRRCREGLDLEKQVSDLTGFQLNKGEDDDSEQVKLVHDMIQEMSKLERRQDWDFNENLREESLSEVTKLDEERVKEILDKSWLSAKQMKDRLSEAELENYVSSLRVKETRKSIKRVMPFPCFLPKYCPDNKGVSLIDEMEVMLEEDLGKRAMMKLWQEGLLTAFTNQGSMTIDTHELYSLNEAMTNEMETKKHNLRKMSEFEPYLTDREKDAIALSGPGAKMRNELEEVIQHEREQKKSFDLDVDCEDIDLFIQGDILTKQSDDDLSEATIEKLIKQSLHSEPRRKVSRRLDEFIQMSEMVRYGQFISDVVLELSYEYKIPHREGKWSCKKMRTHDSYILCRATKTHIFFSLLSKKTSTLSWDTGRLGPEIFEIGDYYMSDFCSLVEASLEHFIKAGPYLSVIGVYLLQHFKLQFLTKDIIIPGHYYQTYKTIFLLYFNNKIDAENLCLDMRFLYMRVLQKYENDPFCFIDRLPSVLRSRLSVYLLKKVLWLMNYYRQLKPKQIRVKGMPMHDPESVTFTNLRCIYHDHPLSLEQLIDSFYFGYIISKSKGKVGDRSFKIVNKIIKEEMWARKHVKEEKNILWSHLNKPVRQHWSSSLLKYFIDLKLKKEISIKGSTFIPQLVDKIMQDLSMKKFSDISTLKASSRDYLSPQINLPNKDLSEMTGTAYIAELKEINPKLKGKRPRVISSLIKLIKDYMKSTDDNNPTLLKIGLFSLKELNARGFFYSDCFPKDQHGGVREIHVLEMRARVVQFFVERSAACMDSVFRSDSILNPKRKDGFMIEHEQYSQAKLGSHTTVCKSADATKWCQRHHVSKFYFLMNRLTAGGLDGLYYNTFSLWTKKRIAIPNELVDILHRAKFDESDNETLLWLREKFLKGEIPFVCEDSNTIEVKFGMMQGIWHKVSSVFHSLIQEVMADLCRAALNAKGIDHVITVIQGSDDSACVISHRERGKQEKLFLHCMLKWKEHVSEYLSIWTSESKSSIGTELLVEYNSEWWFRGKVIRPTFRWISACLETTVIENFYERLQLFYDGLTTAVETGCSTLCASVIQKNQARFHYIMMGFSNHVLRGHMAEQLIEFPHPSLGYFPLECEIHCGLMGFDYNLYCLMKRSNLPLQCMDHEMLHPSSLLDYDDKIDKGLRKEMRNVEVKMGNRKIWMRIVEECDLMTIDDCLSYIKKNPISMYREGHDWEEQEAMMVRKLFDRGVRSSLSSYQPAIRSAVSSSYLFNRPCIRTRDSLMGSSGKISLYKAALQMKQGAHGFGNGQITLDNSIPLFPNQEEYENFRNYGEELLKGFSFQEVHYGRSSKSVVPVWGGISVHELSLMDIIKKQFFQLNTVQVSDSVFRRIWSETKLKYRFLRDKYEETLKATGMDTIQLHDFFQSCSKKTRKLTMQDTTAKFPDIYSTITRVYWPQVKIRTDMASLESVSLSLRHYYFCVLTYFYTNDVKSKMVQDSLQESGLKDVKLRDVPQRLRKLKVMADFLLESNLLKAKEKLIMDTPLVKQGVFGYFSSRQDSDVTGRRMRHSYGGKGKWVGTVCEVPVRIHLDGKHVVLIEIKGMQDSVSLGKRLIKLIEEFKCSSPKKVKSSKSYYYLLGKGHFAVSPLPLEDSYPIEINTELEPPPLEELMKKEWVFSVRDTTIRISCVEDLGQKDSNRITLLSDTMTLRDWVLTSSQRNPPGVNDPLFLSYFKGNPANLMDLFLELGITPGNNYMKNLLSRKGRRDMDMGKYSLNQLADGLRRFILISRSNEESRQRYLEMRAKERDQSSGTLMVTEEEIENILDFGNSELIIPPSSMSWADMVEEDLMMSDMQFPSLDEIDEDEVEIHENMSKHDIDSDSLDDDFQDLETSKINSVMDMFFDLNIEEMKTTEQEYEMMRNMPLENPFWGSIVKVIESEPNGVEIVRAISKNEEPGKDLYLLSQAAFLVSLILGRSVFKEGEEGSSSAAESRISRNTKDPLVYGEEASALIIKLTSELSEIDDAMSGASPLIRKILEDKRQEILIQISSYSNLQDDRIYSDINYWWFFDNFIRVLKEQDIWDKSYLSSDLDTLVTLLLSDSLEALAILNKGTMISDSDFNSMRSRIWDRCVSSFLLRMLGTSLGLGITWYHGNNKIYEFFGRVNMKYVEIKIP